MAKYLRSWFPTNDGIILSVSEVWSSSLLARNSRSSCAACVSPASTSGTSSFKRHRAVLCCALCQPSMDSGLHASFPLHEKCAVICQTVEVIAYCIRVDALRNCNLQFIGEPEQVAMFCIDRSEKDLIFRAPSELRHNSIVNQVQIF